MPWTGKDAKRHTRKATGSLAALWSKVANERLRSGTTEGSAVRQANYVVKRKRGRS